MAWTSPRTWVALEVLTAALLNTHLRDNLLETAPAKVTTQGDTVYATGSSALARLAKGTAGQTLRMNAGATAPEWFNGCPAGMIVMWAGTIATIPSGWVICDGNNGTPNLLARFVKGVATAATNPGTTGGATTHTHASHGVTTGARRSRRPSP